MGGKGGKGNRTTKQQNNISDGKKSENQWCRWFKLQTSNIEEDPSSVLPTAVSASFPMFRNLFRISCSSSIILIEAGDKTRPKVELDAAVEAVPDRAGVLSLSNNEETCDLATGTCGEEELTFDENGMDSSPLLANDPPAKDGS
jgi:hypothetical protein